MEEILNTKLVHLMDLLFFDAKVEKLLQELGGFRIYQRAENKLIAKIKKEQFDDNGIYIFHYPFQCLQNIYYFGDSPVDTDYDEKVQKWRSNLEIAVKKVNESRLFYEALSTLILIKRRRLEGVYDFDVCNVYPTCCDLGGKGNTSTVGKLTYKGAVVNSDRNFLIGKRLNPLCISLLSLFWRSYISSDISEIFATYFNIIKSRYPETHASKISINDIYNLNEDSWWNSWFTYSPQFKTIDRFSLGSEEKYFMLDHDFHVPHDTNELLNKYFMISLERQIAFQRASECYRIALKHYDNNKYMAATYFAISIESLAKFEYKVNNPKHYKKTPNSSKYYKDFFRDNLGTSDALEDIIGTIYKLRCEHVHDGYIPNELWETTELNEMTINSIEKLVHFCLLKWLIAQEITVERIFE